MDDSNKTITINNFDDKELFSKLNIVNNLLKNNIYKGSKIDENKIQENLNSILEEMRIYNKKYDEWFDDKHKTDLNELLSTLDEYENKINLYEQNYCILFNSE